MVRLFPWAFGLLSLLACLPPPLVVCDGKTCAEGYRCTQDQTTCISERCGNGIHEPSEGEECDGSILRPVSCFDRGFDLGVAERCSADCKIVAGDCVHFDWTDISPGDLSCRYLDGTPRRAPAVREMQLLHVWQAAPDTFYAVGYLGERLNDIFTDPDELLEALDAPGLILRHQAGAWTCWAGSSRPGDLPEGALADVWGPPGGDPLVVGAYGVALRLEANAWRHVGPPTSFVKAFSGIWGTEVGELFLSEPRLALEPMTIAHRFDSAWRQIEVDGDFKKFRPIALWASGLEDMFVVGAEGRLLHYDGRAWWSAPRSDALAKSVTVMGAWGTADGDVFAVGGQQTALRLRRASPGLDIRAMRVDDPTRPSSTELTDVWGSGPDDIYAVGNHGSIVHYDGNTEDVWRAMRSPTNRWLFGLSGLGDEDVVVVGEAATVVARSDHRLTETRLPEGAAVHSLWGRGNEMFAAGAEGRIWYHDGNPLDGWCAVPRRTPEKLNHVFGNADTVYVVGSQGSVLKYEGAGRCDGQWQLVGPTWPKDTHVDLHVGWLGPNGELIVAGASRDVPAPVFARRVSNKWWTAELAFAPGTDPTASVDVWGIVGDDVEDLLVIGHRALFRYDGETLTRLADPPFLLRSVSATPSGALFAAGLNGALYFCGLSSDCGREEGWIRGGNLPSVQDYASVWAIDETDVFAVGRHAGVVHYGPQRQWAPVRIGEPGTAPGAVWASDDGRFVFFGDHEGTIYRLERTARGIR